MRQSVALQLYQGDGLPPRDYDHLLVRLDELEMSGEAILKLTHADGHRTGRFHAAIAATNHDGPKLMRSPGWQFGASPEY